MKAAQIWLMVFTIAMVSIASQVSASDKPSNYMVLKGGIYSPSEEYDLDNFNGGYESRLDTKTGFNGEIALGHYFLPILSVELGAGYFESKGSPSAEPGETRLKVVPVLATAKVYLPVGIIEPYGEFGIGAYFTKLEVNGNLSSFEGSSKITYGLHGGVGLNVNLTDEVFVGIEGRYLWAKPSFGGQNVNIDGFTTTADLGFRF
ncbi:MAG: outer membrane beta-barrel protein [Thermodesulfovibrionia bacterium]|nr:outer membrane beta-barrel protein [Thermodesulfovibrionia bacterium]